MIVWTSGLVLLTLLLNAPLLTPIMTLLRLNATSSIKLQVRPALPRAALVSSDAAQRPNLPPSWWPLPLSVAQQPHLLLKRAPPSRRLQVRARAKAALRRFTATALFEMRSAAEVHNLLLASASCLLRPACMGPVHILHASRPLAKDDTKRPRHTLVTALCMANRIALEHQGQVPARVEGLRRVRTSPLRLAARA